MLLCDHENKTNKKLFLAESAAAADGTVFGKVVCILGSEAEYS